MANTDEGPAGAALAATPRPPELAGPEPVAMASLPATRGAATTGQGAGGLGAGNLAAARAGGGSAPATPAPATAGPNGPGAQRGIVIPTRRALSLTGRQKAAIIVRLLMAEDVPIRLSALPEHLQAALTEQIGQMRLVDRTTLRGVIEEFVAELDAVGLAFPGGIDGAISMLDGHISASAANRLRRLAGASGKADPWERISGFEVDRLLPLLERESTEIGAVMLSKLGVAKAATLLQKLPGDRARRIAYAVSLTGGVDPEVVRRIGLALLAQLEAQPPKAFDTDPVQRVGAILNSSSGDLRESLLEGLAETDPSFAEQVRRAIFTFMHIPERLEPRDVPRVLRAVDPEAVLTALVGARGQPATAAAAEFLLANLSQRMAMSMREDMADRGPVQPRDAEAAMAEIVVQIRTLEAMGEIILKAQDDP